MASALPFRSFFMGGFECSSHRRKDGVRLDLIRGTGHDAHALSDYRACAARGLATVRDGLRWHRIEATSGVYDWSSWAPMVEAAAEAGVQVIWDMLHYGCPDYRDAAHPDFVTAFARFAAEAVRLHRSLTGAAALVCPINEISYFTWAVRTGYFPPVGPPEHGCPRHLPLPDRDLSRLERQPPRAGRAFHDPAARWRARDLRTPGR